MLRLNKVDDNTNDGVYGVCSKFLRNLTDLCIITINVIPP